MFITEREDIKPILGLDGLREVNWTIRKFKMSTAPINQSKADKIFTNFEKLFKRNQTIKDTKIKKQSKAGHTPIKQKTRPLPYFYILMSKKNHTI